MYDEASKSLIEAIAQGTPAGGCDDSGMDTSNPSDKEECGIGKLSPSVDSSADTFYPVTCGNCGTNVAVLNMEDEVYQFFGCLASS